MSYNSALEIFVQYRKKNACKYNINIKQAIYLMATSWSKTIWWKILNNFIIYYLAETRKVDFPFLIIWLLQDELINIKSFKHMERNANVAEYTKESRKV